MAENPKETILIVEDEKLIALDLLRRLERFGYDIVGTAVNGTEAYAIAADQRPDLVLMDIMLAGGDDGIETGARLRRELGCAIVFLTAYADATTLSLCRKAEPYGYILKPFKERDLFTAIDMALYKSSMEKKLRRQERLFSAILHSINDAIIATDNDLKVQFMNPVAEELCGWLEADAIGLPISSVAGIRDPRSGSQLFAASIASIADYPIFFGDSVITDRAGKDLVVDGSFARIKEEGNSVEGFLLAMRDISEIKSLSAKVDYQASHDILTGLANREELSLVLQNLLREINEGDEHALLLIDVDRFRAINDTVGSLGGDELLRQVAAQLRELTSRNDSTARMGGDEFGVLLRNCRSADAIQVAKRLQKALGDRKFIWNGVAYPISLSIGIVPIDRSSGDLRGILASADDACVMAREEGGDRVSLFGRQDSRFERKRDEKRWIGRLTHAAENDGFVLYAQPIQALGGRRRSIRKHEILLRLRNDDGSLAMPGEFIPAAERYNLMGMVDRWVAERAIRGLHSLAQAGLNLNESLYCINLSGTSLLDDSMSSYIQDLCQAWGVPPTSICLEITETAAIQNLSYASRFIRGLKDKGFTFALDDFGSGFSSFGYLQNLAVDYLKIDGSFVRKADKDKVSYTMVESINSMGHAMGLKTIAEYVESPAIAKCLERIGVDYLQGFAIAMPGPLLAEEGPSGRDRPS